MDYYDEGGINNSSYGYLNIKTNNDTKETKITAKNGSIRTA